MKIVSFHWGIVAGRRSVFFLLRQCWACLCGADLPKWLTLIINVLSDLLNHADPVICFAPTIQKMFTFQVCQLKMETEKCILVNYYSAVWWRHSQIGNFSILHNSQLNLQMSWYALWEIAGIERMGVMWNSYHQCIERQRPRQYVHGKWTSVCIQNIMVSSAVGNNT